jgi:hypothetical protein
MAGSFIERLVEIVLLAAAGTLGAIVIPLVFAGTALFASTEPLGLNFLFLSAMLGWFGGMILGPLLGMPLHLILQALQGRSAAWYVAAGTVAAPMFFALQSPWRGQGVAESALNFGMLACTGAFISWIFWFLRRPDRDKLTDASSASIG